MFRYLLTYLSLCVWLCASAQKPVPALEREVTLKVSDEAISTILPKISTQTGIKFSYSPSFVAVDKRVSFVLKKKPVRTVLQIMFGDEVQYKQKGDFIILIAKAQSPVVKEITFSGYVYDANGDKLTSASILSKSEHISAVTNQYGYYKLSVPADKFPVKIKVEKENYIDTTLTVHASQRAVDVVLNIPPQPKTEPAKTDTIQVKEEVPVIAPDTIAQQASTPIIDTTAKTETAGLPPPCLPLEFPKIKLPRFHFDSLFLSGETKANMRNIKDTLFAKVQFSLIPYVSTNKLLAGNTVNDVSFNLLVGYSQGVNIFEIGGLINIDREDVKCVQLAGLINAVGGNVKGIQAAGWGNLNSGSGEGVRLAGITNVGNNMDGIQLAGIVNVNADYKSGIASKSFKGLTESKVKGVQAAGIVNVNAGYTEGFSLAGLYNACNKTRGVQIAGIANGNLGYMHGLQIAGLWNLSVDTSTGAHIAGLINVNGRRTEGAHIAGLVNVGLADVEGVQITSILNIAGKMKGTQIALINISDTCEGVPFGLLTLSSKGYHKLEAFGDELIYTQLAFRTGVPHFHNIFNAGIDMTRRFEGLWCFGYGLGTTFRTGEKWNFTADALSQVLLKKGDIEDAPQVITLFTGFERRFGNKFSIGFGPTCKLLINDSPQNSEYTSITKQLVPYSVYDRTFSNGNTLDLWVGGKLSFKFF